MCKLLQMINLFSGQLLVHMHYQQECGRRGSMSPSNARELNAKRNESEISLREVQGRGGTTIGKRRRVTKRSADYYYYDYVMDDSGREGDRLSEEDHLEDNDGDEYEDQVPRNEKSRRRRRNTKVLRCSLGKRCATIKEDAKEGWMSQDNELDVEADEDHEENSLKMKRQRNMTRVLNCLRVKGSSVGNKEDVEDESVSEDDNSNEEAL